MSATALESELATPLAPIEQSLGGCAPADRARASGRPMGDARIARVLHHLIAEVMLIAPRVKAIRLWRASDRLAVQRWAERSFAIKNGHELRPLDPPPVLLPWVVLSRQKANAVRAQAASAALAGALR